jgi:nucleoside-diphosphate-sugar epimerase
MFTVLGAVGSIGSRLVAALRESPMEVFAPERDDERIYDRFLGHVVYCIGVTADFRSRHFDTVDAHVGVLRRVLETARYGSFLYLSSARVYKGLEEGREDASLLVRPSDPDDLYNASKLLGEALCLSRPEETTRVVRLSNVVGPDATSPSFAQSVIAQAVDCGFVTLQTDPASTRNYVDIRDVVEMIPLIAAAGRSRLYNIAGACETTHAEFLALVQRETGCRVDLRPEAPLATFPPITIDLARQEFAFAPRRLEDSVSDMVAAYRKSSADRSTHTRAVLKRASDWVSG